MIAKIDAGLYAFSKSSYFFIDLIFG